MVNGLATIQEKPYHVTANLSIKYEMDIKIENQKLTKDVFLNKRK